jgi:hypothetical protein
LERLSRQSGCATANYWRLPRPNQTWILEEIRSATAPEWKSSHHSSATPPAAGDFRSTIYRDRLAGTVRAEMGLRRSNRGLRSSEDRKGASEDEGKFNPGVNRQIQNDLLLPGFNSLRLVLTANTIRTFVH